MLPGIIFTIGNVVTWRNYFPANFLPNRSSGKVRRVISGSLVGIMFADENCLRQESHISVRCKIEGER